MREPATVPAEGAWRVEHEGMHGMYYEEFVNGQWRRLDLNSELCSGPAHHLVFLPSAEAWKSHPAWASDRRDEIVKRIRWICGSGYGFHEG